MKPQPKRLPSPLAEALRRVGDRWSLLVVDALGSGPQRFTDLIEHLPGIASNVLADRLRRLTDEGVLLASPYSERPERFLYDLTDTGRELERAIRLVAHWGATTAEDPESARHPACGTPLEARWYCPTCARTVEQDRGDLHFL